LRLIIDQLHGFELIDERTKRMSNLARVLLYFFSVLIFASAMSAGAKPHVIMDSKGDYSYSKEEI